MHERTKKIAMIAVIAYLTVRIVGYVGGKLAASTNPALQKTGKLLTG